MTKKIVAFGASNSIYSINKRFAVFVANQVKDAEVKVLDLNDFEMPIYSIDREKATGIPALAQQFKAHIQAADGIIISFAEHNSAYTVAYKNIYDWMSRMEGDIWKNKPLFLMATSPGGRGGKSVLAAAIARNERGHQHTIARFSLPYFNKFFSEEKGISDKDLNVEFREQLALFEGAL